MSFIYHFYNSGQTHTSEDPPSPPAPSPAPASPSFFSSSFFSASALLFAAAFASPAPASALAFAFASPSGFGSPPSAFTDGLALAFAAPALDVYYAEALIAYYIA